MIVHPYLAPNSILQLLSGLVALLVSYYAFRYGRVATSSFLRLLSLGFMLLGLGLLAQGSVLTLYLFNIGRITDRINLTYEATALYLLLQVVAYLLIGLGYARRMHTAPNPEPKTSIPAAALVAMAASTTIPALRTRLFEFSELVTIILVALIAFQALLVYSENRSRFPLLVLTAFTLILFAHIGSLLSAVLSSGALYLVGGLIQLAGFSVLLYFVIRSGRVGTA